MTNEEKVQKISDTYQAAAKASLSMPKDAVRDDWSDGRLLREILEKVLPLGVLDEHELVGLEYVAARIDSIDEERHGVEGMGEI